MLETLVRLQVGREVAGTQPRRASGPAGHVAIYVGSGMIASTDMPVIDKIGIVPAEWIEQKWAGTYVGWSPPYFAHGGGVGSH